MARRRIKKRTHVGTHQNGANAASKPSAGARTPKSMVIRIGAGEVGPSIGQLVKDVRSMMEPNTASRLQERRSNKLRDYTTMAGPLGVTHLMLFSRSSSGNINFRLAITPRGPTFHFRVEKYALCKDIANSQKHPKHGSNKEHLTAPLLAMNNFASRSSEQSKPKNAVQPPKVPKHLESLATSVFQSLFPAISPQTTPLSSIRRVLLLNRETASTSTNVNPSQSYVLNLRHYTITTKRTGLSRGIRRIDAAAKLIRSKQSRGRGTLPNMGRLDDVADYLLDPVAGNYTSGSESEVETDAEVEVLEAPARRVVSRRDRPHGVSSNAGGSDRTGTSTNGAGNVEKRAVKLVEIGPRMTLRLMKVEEGVCQGKVMWHENIEKSRDEVKRMDEVWEKRKVEKEERKREQKENVDRKRREKGEKTGGPEDTEDLEDDDWDSEGLEADEDGAVENGVALTGVEEEDDAMKDGAEEEVEDEDEG